MNSVKYKTGIGFLFVMLGRKTEYEWSQFLKRHGVTTTEFTALTVISGKDGITQKQLAADIEVDPRNIVATIKKLQSLAWITTTVDQKDGRAKNLSISIDGAKALRLMDEDLRQVEANFLQNISVKEKEQLEKILLKLK